MSKLPAKGPYFLVDDRIIEDRWMIERFVVPFEKYSNNPVVEKELPWEGSGPLMGGTVLFDKKEKLYKMWYLVWDEHAYFEKLPYSYNICYAESKDGIKWEKPILNLFDRRGTIDKKNNFIVLGRQKTQGIDVELNPTPNSPAEKYIAIHNDSDMRRDILRQVFLFSLLHCQFLNCQISSPRPFRPLRSLFPCAPPHR